MPKILYLHGFGSCGEGNKSGYLRSFFGSDVVIAPDLPASPLEAIDLIESILFSHPVTLLIGSSLGGYYASYLAEKYGMKAVLINPSTQPWKTLAPYVGWHKRYCDGEPFELKVSDLDALKTLQIHPKKGQYLLLLQTGDEVLDYTKAQSLYNKHKIIVEQGGNHRFENVNEYLFMIENFMEK